MMATTHALVGVAVASAVALHSPEFGTVAIAAAFAGGLFPDLDLYAGHRKTLHYPVLYWIPTSAAGVAVLVAPSALTVGVASFLLSAALHSVMDVFGSGLELRPWREESERAVYDHVGGRWLRPRRWVRYDGAPEDALLGATLAVPGLLIAEEPVRWAVAAALVGSLGYAALRRHVPTLTERAVAAVPHAWHGYLPDRFLDG